MGGRTCGDKKPNYVGRDPLPPYIIRLIVSARPSSHWRLGEIETEILILWLVVLKL